jgi:hypothetical protein
MDLTRRRGKWSWPKLTYCHGIYLEGLRQITKNLSQVSRSASEPTDEPGTSRILSMSANHSAETLGTKSISILFIIIVIVIIIIMSHYH